MNTALFIKVVIIAIGAFNLLYIVINIVFQKQAEKKLEKMLKDDIKLSGLINKHNIHDAEQVISFVKEEINKLRGRDRTILSKVINRKNSFDQKNYATKIFEDCGLINYIEPLMRPKINH